MLKKLLKQQEQDGTLDFWGEPQYRVFCNMIGEPPEKWKQVQEIYLKNLEVYVVSTNNQNEQGEEYNIIDLDSANIYNKDVVEREIMERVMGKADLTETLLIFLDNQIFPILPEARKVIWPDLFTISFTSEYIDTTWDRLKKNLSNTLTRSLVISDHWEEIGLEGCREQYGRDQYHFIVDWIFAYMLKLHYEVNPAYMREKHRGCSAAYLSKEKGLLFEKIRSLRNEIYT